MPHKVKTPLQVATLLVTGFLGDIDPEEWSVDRETRSKERRNRTGAHSRSASGTRRAWGKAG